VNPLRGSPPSRSDLNKSDSLSCESLI